MKKVINFPKEKACLTKHNEPINIEPANFVDLVNSDDYIKKGLEIFYDFVSTPDYQNQVNFNFVIEYMAKLMDRLAIQVGDKFTQNDLFEIEDCIHCNNIAHEAQGFILGIRYAEKILSEREVI